MSRPVHFEIQADDLERAKAFYGAVFGWTFETYGGENDLETYTLALADGLPIGGLVFDQRVLKGKVPSARWIGLISVPDVRAAADAVARAGGKVMVAPVMLGERGETAVFLGDVCPTAAHVPLPWIMGYDVEPLRTLESKRALWKDAEAGEWLVIFEHDATTAWGRVGRGSKGIELRAP